MAKAKKLPSGRWRCRVFSYTDADGKKHYESFTADTKKEAEFLALEWLQHKEDRERPAALTVKEAIRRYMEAKSSVLSPSTLRGYNTCYRSAYTGIEHENIYKMNSRTLQIWINQYAAEHSPKTVRNAYGLLIASIQMFRPDFSPHPTLPAKKKADLYTPSDSEIKQVISYIREKDPELTLAVMLAAFGPMRRGEICALDRSDIQGRTIHITKSMVRDDSGAWCIKQPKTYSSYRSIEFPQFVIDMIPEGEGPIFSSSPDYISEKFDRALKKAGIPHFRFHDLRSYCASILHYIGVPDQAILNRGGWASDYVMKSIYRREISEERVKQEAIIQRHFEAVGNSLS